MSKIVILAGSPRPGGNSDLLAEAFARKASAKHEVKILHVGRMSIAPCRGCNACFAEGNRCAQQDDMGQVYRALAEADVLGIASPVYFYGISAQLAAAINRLHNPLRETFPIRRAFLLLSAASHKPHVCEAIKLQYTLLLNNFGIEDLGIVAAQGANAPGDVAGTEYIRQVEDLSEKI